MPTGGGECGCSQDGGKRKKKAVSKKRRLTNYNKFMRNEIQKVKKFLISTIVNSILIT